MAPRKNVDSKQRLEGVRDRLFPRIFQNMGSPVCPLTQLMRLVLTLWPPDCKVKTYLRGTKL